MKKFVAVYQKEEVSFAIEEVSGGGLRIVSGNKEWLLDVNRAGEHHYSVLHENQSYDLRFFHAKEKIDAMWSGEHLAFTLCDEKSLRQKSVASGGRGGSTIAGPVAVEAMMPGKIASVKVKKGDPVAAGQGVVILEAMKMENELVSPKDGKVTEVKVQEGQSVESGAVLVIVE